MTPRRRHPATGQRDAERSAMRSGAAALLATVLVTAVVFHPHWPFSSGYEIRAVFSSATQLKPGKPVRMAGIEVGRVSAIGRGPHNTSIVRMQIDDSARPLHSDATARIEPRLILEGNFYVDLRPGTPDAPEMPNGGTIPLRRTAAPVQLDQFLDTFNARTRSSLKSFTRETARGLGPKDLSRSGAGGLRRADRQLDAGLHDLTVASAAFRGSRRGDLTRTVRSFGDFTSQLAEDPSALADLMTNMNRVTAALAANDRALGASMREVNRALEVTPPALNALDHALPTVRSFAVALRPALQSAPPALHATGDLLAQTAAFASPRELPGLVDALTPVVKTLPGLEQKLGDLFPLVTPVNECVRTHVVPVEDMKIEDGPLSTGRPVWQDMVHSWVGGANGSPNFDANGKNIRVQVATGDNVIESFIPGLGKVATGVGTQIEGTAPVWLGRGKLPAHRPDAPCLDQALPNLRLRRASGVPKGMQQGDQPPSGRRAVAGRSLARLLEKLVAHRPGGHR